MQDYERKIAQKGAQQNTSAPVQAKTNGIPNSAMAAVFAGKQAASSAMLGHNRNLAPSIATKMSRAFGMDLTGMQVYQSDAMVGSGMQGMAQGNKVVLSSDVDLNTTAGQAVLGHEISHIHAQSQGIGMGHSGLYENAALEHQADTEGLLAAQGKSIYQSGGMDMGGGMSYGLGMQGVEGLTPLSGGISANAGAPMQAKKNSKGLSQEEKNALLAEYIQAHPEQAFTPGSSAGNSSFSLEDMSDTDMTGVLFDKNGRKRTAADQKDYIKQYRQEQRALKSHYKTFNENFAFYKKQEAKKAKGGFFKNLFKKKKSLEEDPSDIFHVDEIV